MVFGAGHFLVGEHVDHSANRRMFDREFFERFFARDSCEHG